MRIRLAVLDSDKNYLGRLATVFSNKYADKIQFYSFTDMQMALNSVQAGKAEVFLANERFQIDRKQLPERCCFAYIAEKAEIESIQEQPVIFKYQRADLFYKQILSFYAENSKSASGYRFSKETKTHMVVFGSFSGGTGASTIAASFCRYAAGAGQKVLYLNLEPFGNAESFFTGNGQYDLSDVLYALKSRKNNMALKLESTVRQDGSGVYFYASPKAALHLMEMDEGDTGSLLDDLRSSGSYDSVVVDMEMELTKKSAEILTRADETVFVSDGSDIANSKLTRGYQAFRMYEQQNGESLIGRGYLIYNKFSNKTSKIVENMELEKLGGVPKFEHATTVQLMEQLSKETFFEKLLM